MSLNIELTKAFGWSVLVWGPGHYILGWILGSKVIKARETLKVPLPNLYATPGVRQTLYYYCNFFLH